MSDQTRHITAAGAAIVLALALASCDKGERRSNVSSPTGPSPTATPGLARVDLLAPSTIGPGESAQLTANAVLLDSSVQNVTEQAQWTSSNPRVLEISATGVAKGIANGDATINVRYQSRSASKGLIVVPTGTYRLKGRVTEDGLGLAGVTVTVIGGVGEGVMSMTGADGSYILYGVSGHVRLHAKLDGYSTSTQELDLADHRTFDFEMVPNKSRRDLRGTYTLKVEAACSNGSLPPAVATRAYDASVAQDGPRLTVTLTGADFIITRGHGDHFGGTLDGSDRVTFAIGNASFYYYYYYAGQYDIVELLTSASALIVNGIVTATANSSGIAGTLTGDVMVAQGSTAPFTRFQARCYSTAHRFEMVRR